MSYFKALDVRYSDSASIDAFSRARVSELTTLCDLKQLHDQLPLLIDIVNSGGTSTYNSNESSTTLATTDSGQYVIAQTKQFYSYQSGKSQLILQTFYDFTPQTNIVKRIGYFSSSTSAPYTANFDGIYLESSNGVVTAKIDRNGTNIDSADQSNWNIDKLDGTGISRITVDWSKNQIFVIDFQYLGVGRVRLGIDVNGLIYYFHQFSHANTIQKVYMTSSNQPLRWEIRQTGAGSGSFTYICASVASEGGINSVGMSLSKDTGTTAIATNIIGATYALLGVRLKSTNRDSFVNLLKSTILATTADQFYFKLILNPTIAGTFTFVDVANASVQVAIGNSANTVTGGIDLLSEVSINTQISDVATPKVFRMGSTINGTMDRLVLCVTPISSNINMFAAINWEEIY